MPLFTDSEFTWSIPAKSLRSLLDALKEDVSAWAGKVWDGHSETLKQYLERNEIDPKTHPKYCSFYVHERHSVAGSYTWRFTHLYEFADKADEPSNIDEKLFIDVLLIPQFRISTSLQVVRTTDRNYFNCNANSLSQLQLYQTEMYIF